MDLGIDLEGERPVKTPDLFRLDGKVAIVSGGAGIVGNSIVRALAESGAHVVVSSRNIDSCQGVASLVSSEGWQAEAIACDFSVDSQILSLRDAVLQKHGKIDILFNNAVARAGGDLFDTNAEEWDTVMALNSHGFFLSCRIFGEVMARQRSGSIVNVASIYGMVGPDFHLYEGTPLHNTVSYSFAKGGMINMTRYLASYLAPYGVRVNALSPGGVETPQTPARFIENYGRRAPMGRMARGIDLQGVAVFLASEASSYVTGQNIAVDGGWTAI